jgi:hypothetical protein
MKTITSAVSLLVLLTLLVPNRAPASIVFEGTFNHWAPDGDDPIVFGTGTSELTWGDPDGWGVGSSVVSYEPYEVPTDWVLSGSPFAMGKIQYFNGTIRLGTGISAASLELDSWSDDSGFNAGFTPVFKTESTPNVGTPEENADYLYFVGGPESSYYPQFFNVFEGGSASASLVARLDMLFPNSGPKDGMTSGSPVQYELTILGFENVEGEGFLTFAAIDAVPEPSSIVIHAGLFALMLLTFRANRRRERS